MAPRPLSKLVVTRLAHHTGTLQWHPAMAPCPLPQSWSLPSPRPTIAHYKGTTSTPPKLVVTLPLNHSTLQWHPTMAPSNGTTSTAPCNGTLVPRPIRQSGSSPSPLLEVRTPIAIAIWGKIYYINIGYFFSPKCAVGNVRTSSGTVSSADCVVYLGLYPHVARYSCRVQNLTAIGVPPPHLGTRCMSSSRHKAVMVLSFYSTFVHPFGLLE